ncbi:DNA repair protein rad50 isoform X2 [Xylocopa sonorina]|uniref:DNA repair protein rad50 isoform X2 n=1 Tax=Xylocopa sonorina TaxID=1818115 RepID=UPI00403AB814
MSRIRRLSIRGIRNFGDENEEASLRFSRPLTLILGPNGTGKTTIIEALKYATCGEFPPGSDRGKYFIHDPTLTRAPSVRGVVKAEVIDAMGNLFTISRTMESSRTNTTIKFKTLDSTLSRLKKGSTEVISITNRCANVDAELTLAMGVSKPILDYVIFCHQEDLNWPFQDGKKLKEKFDEIFDSARFNKALESITKYLKDLREKVNILKEQKRSSQVVVGEVEEKEKKLADYKKRLESSKAKIMEFNKELEPLNQKLKMLEKETADYKDLQSEAKNKNAEYDMYKQQLNKLQEDLEYTFDGTTEELMRVINSYDERLLKTFDEIKESEENLKDFDRKESKISNALANERVTNGSLRQQIKDQEKKVALRNRILNEALSAWNIDKVESNVSDIEVIVHSKRLEEKMGELEKRTEENRAEREREEKELQKTVDILRSGHSKMESEKCLKENEVIETRAEIDKIKSEILQLGMTTNKLDSIKSEVEEAQEKIRRLKEAMNVDAVKEEIVAKTNSRNEIEALLNSVDEEIALLLKQNSFQTELELHKSSLATKEKEMEKLKTKHKENIMILFDIKELTHTKLKNNLDAIQKELIAEIESINTEIKKEEHQITTLETTISHTEHEFEKKKKEIESNKHKISSICNYKEFDEVLLLQSKKVKDLQDKRGIYAHQGAAYKEYMKQLKDTNPCCPLCRRGFEKHDTLVDLLKELENEMTNHPSRLKECEKELKMQQEKYDKMLQLNPVIEKIKQFEEDEAENNNLEKAKNKLAISQTNATELKKRKCNPESKLTICKNIMGDIILWDSYIDESLKLQEIINDFHTRMVTAGIKTKRSLQEAQAQREELKMSLTNIRDDIENLQTKMNVHNEQTHNARQEYNALHEQQLKIQTDLQTLKELKDRQKVLYSKEISLGELVRTLKKKVTESEAELNSGIKQLEIKKEDNRVKYDADRNLVADRLRRLSELQKAQEDVDTFVYRKVPECLESSELKIKSYEKTLNTFRQQKSNIEATINKLNEDVARHKIRKRELSDNVTLRKVQEKTRKLEQQYLNIQKKLNAIDYAEILDEWKKSKNSEELLLRQKNVLRGNQEELERAVQQYTEELKKELYRNARKTNKKLSIEVTVAEEAILNLRAYSRALDNAMIEYHEERMSSVNRIMKEMWRVVYKGTDTTAIEIRTEATEGIGSARRTYNYKLVQIKHGHEIDMKGRCSAGQKVLASIIIRLALAETFCKDCGILALDEPTTNLDQENADSLANALSMVVRLRSQYQKNFQLIVISHDEKFLFKLAELSSNKGFYQLYRKATGYTAIRHCVVGTRDYSETDTVKEEMSSDEESNEHSNSRNRSATSLWKGAHSVQTNKKKRHIWDSDDEGSTQSRPSKKRYVFQ